MAIYRMGRAKLLVMRELFHMKDATVRELNVWTGLGASSLYCSLHALERQGLASNQGEKWALTDEGITAYRERVRDIRMRHDKLNDWLDKYETFCFQWEVDNE